MAFACPGAVLWGPSLVSSFLFWVFARFFYMPCRSGLCPSGERRRGAGEWRYPLFSRSPLQVKLDSLCLSWCCLVGPVLVSSFLSWVFARFCSCPVVPGFVFLVSEGAVPETCPGLAPSRPSCQMPPRRLRLKACRIGAVDRKCRRAWHNLRLQPAAQIDDILLQHLETAVGAHGGKLQDQLALVAEAGRFEIAEGRKWS